MLFRVASWIVAVVQKNKTIHAHHTNNTKLVTTDIQFEPESPCSLLKILCIHKEHLSLINEHWSPGFVWIEAVNCRGNLGRIWTEVLFIDHAIVTNHKGLYTRDSVLRWSCD